MALPVPPRSPGPPYGFPPICFPRCMAPGRSSPPAVPRPTKPPARRPTTTPQTRSPHGVRSPHRDLQPGRPRHLCAAGRHRRRLDRVPQRRLLLRRHLQRVHRGSGRRRANIVATATATGTISSVTIDGIDIQTLDTPATSDPPALDWAHVWPTDVVAGEPVWVSFHSRQPHWDTTGTGQVVIETDAGTALDTAFTVAESPLRLTAVTTDNAGSTGILFVRNDSPDPVEPRPHLPRRHRRHRRGLHRHPHPRAGRRDPSHRSAAPPPSRAACGRPSSPAPGASKPSPAGGSSPSAFPSRPGTTATSARGPAETTKTPRRWSPWGSIPTTCTAVCATTTCATATNRP